MAIITIGIDLAKNVFAMHGIDESGKPALVRPNVKRAAVPPVGQERPSDAADVQAICGAVSRPNMRFVPVSRGRCLPAWRA